MKIDKMGVFVLMSHLLITLAIIGVYFYTLSTGHADETLKTVLTVIVGYWFGAVGMDKIKGNKNE
jgi:TctA family transporter